MSDILQKQAIKFAQLQAKKLDLEIELKKITDELNQLLQHDVPEEMLTNQLKKVTLDNGVEFVCVKEFSGGISYERGLEAAKLLFDNGYVFNWTTNIKIPSTDSPGITAGLNKVLQEYNLPELKSKPDIHHSTFKKICRELNEKELLDVEAQQKLGVVTAHVATAKLSI